MTDPAVSAQDLRAFLSKLKRRLRDEPRAAT